jgi:hypothetical protein
MHLHTGGISEYRRPNRSNAKKSDARNNSHESESIVSFDQKRSKKRGKKVISNDEIEYYKMRFPFDLSCSCREARDSIMLHHDSNGIWLFDKFETVVDQFYAIMNDKIINLKYNNCEEFIKDCKLFEKAITRSILVMEGMKGKLKEIEAHISSILEIFTDSCIDLEENVENDVCSLDDKVLSMSSTRNDSYVAEFFTDSISAALEESDESGIAIDDDCSNIGAATIKVLHMLYERGQSAASLIHVNNNQNNKQDYKKYSSNNNVTTNNITSTTNNNNIINKEKNKRKRLRFKANNAAISNNSDTSDDNPSPVAVTCSRVGRIINPKQIYDSSEGISNYDKKSSVNSSDFSNNSPNNVPPPPIVKTPTSHISKVEKKSFHTNNVTKVSNINNEVKVDTRLKHRKLVHEKGSTSVSANHNPLSSIDNSPSVIKPSLCNNSLSNSSNSNNINNNSNINNDDSIILEGNPSSWGKTDQELQLLHQQANGSIKMNLSFNNNGSNYNSVFERYQINSKSGNYTTHSSNKMNNISSASSLPREYGSAILPTKGNMNSFDSSSSISCSKKGVAVLKKYSATIQVCDRTIHVGQFDSEIEAAIGIILNIYIYILSII